MECLRRSHAFYKFHNHRQKIGIASVLHAEYDLQRIYMLQVYIISHIQDCKVPLKKLLLHIGHVMTEIGKSERKSDVVTIKTL